jgi:hypothetical protein
VKVIICVNRFLATLYGVQLGTIVDIRDKGCPMCEHESRYYDEIPVSDEVWKEIGPHWDAKETLIYDHENGSINIKNKRE